MTGPALEAPGAGAVRSAGVIVTFAGSGDAFGSGGRLQACLHLRAAGADAVPLLADCGTSALIGLRRADLETNEIGAVIVSHLHGDHFGGLPFLILDGQFRHRSRPLTVAGPPGIGERLHQAMEILFPGSGGISRRFALDIVELAPGTTTAVGEARVTAWEARHPSGAPPLVLRVELGGRVIAYTGDTAWTEAIVSAAHGADLLIAESYKLNHAVRHHLSHADLDAHRAELGPVRVVLTHMSQEVLDEPGQLAFEAAHDGLTLRI